MTKFIIEFEWQWEESYRLRIIMAEKIAKEREDKAKQEAEEALLLKEEEKSELNKMINQQ